MALSRRDVFPSMPSKAGRRGPFRAPDTDPSLGKGARGGGHRKKHRLGLAPSEAGALCQPLSHTPLGGGGSWPQAPSQNRDFICGLDF